MEQQGRFTAEERRAFLILYRKALRAAHYDLPFTLRRRMQTFIERELAEGFSLHDDLGLNRLNTALATILETVNEIGLHGDSLLSCLLHAVVITPEQLQRAQRLFGESLCRPLSSYMSAERLLSTKVAAMESDDFRNLFVSQCGDMRVILLLIVDCVIRMRQIKNTPFKEAQQKLSVEAAYIYAPLAHKLGLYTIKSELEDLSLKYLEHDAYYHIKDKLNATKTARDAYVERFIAPLREKLDAEGLQYKIKGRTKSIYSIWKKMQKQHCAFEGVYDLFAIRVIIDAPIEEEKALCWKVFSLITYEYESNLKRLRDWLTVPKSNGYESLHITVLGPKEKWVEVQIRSQRMDETAEHGLAAHWRYKGIKGGDGNIDSWLANIRSALERGDEQSLSENLGSKLEKSAVYVFSPKGDLYKLPVGASVLDFAYHIHTGLGNRCVGGKINGKNVSFRQRLESGQKVEIITSSSQTPKLEWLDYVVSPRSKAKIRAALNDRISADGNIAKETFERKFRNRKIEWVESIWNYLIIKLGYKETNEFYKAVADETLDINEIIDQYIAIYNRENTHSELPAVRSAEEFNQVESPLRDFNLADDILMIGKDLKGLDFEMAKCCSPVYGDQVFGFVTVNGGIKIHRTSCPNAAEMKTRYPYRIVQARWAGKGTSRYPITLRVIGNDDLGVVNNLTSIISKEEAVGLRSIKIEAKDGLFVGILTLLVNDNRVLNTLIKKLKIVKGVKAISRT